MRTKTPTTWDLTPHLLAGLHVDWGIQCFSSANGQVCTGSVICSAFHERHRIPGKKKWWKKLAEFPEYIVFSYVSKIFRNRSMSLILATTGRAKTLVSLKAPHHFVSGRLSERIPPPRVIGGPAVSGRARQNCKYIDPIPVLPNQRLWGWAQERLLTRSKVICILKWEARV